MLFILFVIYNKSPTSIFHFRQIMTIKTHIEKKIDYINSARIFEPFLNNKGSGLKNFEEFHNEILESESKDIDVLVGHYQDICPLLMKIEELLEHSRTKKHKRMKDYFAHWERKIYDSLSNMVKNNLEDFQLLIESRQPLFAVEVILSNMNIAIRPSEQMILKGIVLILKCLLDGTRKFIRWAHGSCIFVIEARVKGEIRPVRPSFYDDVVRIPQIIEKVHGVQNSIVETLENVQSYLSSWKKYRNLWKFDKTNTCSKFLERLPSCVDFDAKLLYYSLLERQIAQREDTTNYNCLQVALNPIKASLLGETHEWINCLGKLLEETAKEELQGLQVTLEKLNGCLKYPTNGEELETVLHAIAKIWKMSLQVEISYREIEEKYRTLQMYGIDVEKSQIDSAQKLPTIWEKIFYKSKEVHFRVRPMKEKYTEITKLLVRKFQKEANDLYEVFKKEGPSSVGSELDEGLELLSKYQVDFKNTCDRAKALNDQEKLYVLPLTDFTVLKVFKDDLEVLESIYQLYLSYSHVEQRWKSLTWKVLDLDMSERDLNQFETDLNELVQKFDNKDPLGEIRKRMNKTKHLFFILRKLKESKLRPRHWKEIELVTKVDIDEDINFKLESFWDIQLEDLEVNVNKIINQASHERKIESELQEIKEIWEGLKFVLVKYSSQGEGESIFILGDISEILDNLLVHQGLLDQMDKSIYSLHFSKDIEFWKNNLSLIEKVVEEWMNLQEIWIKLSKALSIKGFREHLDDAHAFDDISKRFVRIMIETAKKPTVKDICLSQGFLSTIEFVKKDLEEFHNQLGNAFDIKRKQFPRFFFLSDDELLTVLGGNIRDGNIQKLIKSLFQQLSEFVPDEVGNIESVSTNDHEDLMLVKAVNTENQPIEMWLSNLVEEVRHSMKLSFVWGLKYCQMENQNFFEALSDNPKVLAIAIFEKLWNDKFMKAFEATGSEFPVLNEWKKLYEFSSSLLQRLVDPAGSFVKDKPQLHFLVKLITSKKDLLDYFLNIGLRSKADFHWERQMKYVWNKENAILEIHQGFCEIDYGYEFMGIDSISVNCGESERVWFLINEIIRNHNIPYLSGIPGSGKTTLIEDLGKKLGKGWRSISLTENFTTDSVVRYMRGICESNLWGIFENINILKASLMSVISSYFQTVKTAQILYLREFSLDNKLTTMSSKVAFVCTESHIEHTTELTAIPLSLKILFRKINVELPDMQKLFTTLMRIEGMKYPVTMSTQLLAVSKIITEVLNLKEFSKIKLFKVFTLSVSKLTHKFKEMPEAQIFFNILADHYRNLLTGKQFIVAQGILKNFFNIDKSISQPLETKEEIDFTNIGRDLTNGQKKDVETLLGMLKLSDSVIVVGDSFIGKSKVISTTMKMMNTLSTYYLDPKSHSDDVLLGSSLNDGIIGNLFQKGSNGFVIHIDGSCTEKIALPLSYIIDRGEYFSGGGKKFSFDGSKKFIIETTSLSNVSESMIAKSLVLNIKHNADDMSKAIISSNLEKVVEEKEKVEKYCIIAIKMYDCLRKSTLSDIDRFLHRSEQKKLTETFSLLRCLVQHQQSSSLVDLMLFSFLFVFGSCEDKLKKLEMLASVKSCLLHNKEIFGDAKILEVIDEISVKNDSSLENKIACVSTLLLKSKIPVLMIGGHQAQKVFDGILEQIEPKESLFNVNFQALSDAEDINKIINDNFIKRGKSSLVPYGLREVIISASDLSTPIGTQMSLPITILKDIADKKSIAYNGILCNISDVNTICKVTSTAKYFAESRSFNNFVCMFVHDEFEDMVDMFHHEMKEKVNEENHINLGKICKSIKDIIVAKHDNIKPVKMVKLLKQLKLYGKQDDLANDYAKLLYEEFVSCELSQDKRSEITIDIQRYLHTHGLNFATSYDIDIDQTSIPDSVTLSSEQMEQVKEISNFILNRGKFLSIFGDYGYGKTLLLEVAANNTNHALKFVTGKDDLEIETDESCILVVRDSYISSENFNVWLELFVTVTKHKVVFMMSSSYDQLSSFTEFITSSTQVMAIPVWKDDSYVNIMEGVKDKNIVKNILLPIHKMMIQNSDLSNEKFSANATFKDFLSFVRDTEEENSAKIAKNENYIKEIKAIVHWLAMREEHVKDSEEKIHENEKKIEDYKAKMKEIKKQLKRFEDDKAKYSNDLKDELAVNNDLKQKREIFNENYEQLKASSFNQFFDARSRVEALTREEMAMFSKPMLVHEDVEKITSILTFLVNIDVLNWKLIKDKFLAIDWQDLLEEFDPDTCKHKQEFLINQKLAEIKTPRSDMEKISTIASLFWDYIEGALKGFKTKFERDKLKKEIDEYDHRIGNSEKELEKIKKALFDVEKEIKLNEDKHKNMRESCNELESKTVKSKYNLQIEKNFLSQSKSLEEAFAGDLKKTSHDVTAILSDTIVDKAVNIYFIRFSFSAKPKVYEGIKAIFNNNKLPDKFIEESKKSVLSPKIEGDFCKELKLKTSKRIIYCYDPSDIVKIQLRSNECCRTMKLVNESDVGSLMDYIESEEFDCIVVEDVYFENKNIVNKLLDDELERIKDLAKTYDKFVFLLAKESESILPHHAYSEVYFINLEINGPIVLSMMVSLFNDYSQRNFKSKFDSLKSKEEELVSSINECKANFYKLIANNEEGVSEEIIQNCNSLLDLENSLVKMEQEIEELSQTADNNMSDLAKCGSPILYALYKLSYFQLILVSSFFAFFNTPIKTAEEDTVDLMMSIFSRYTFGISEKGRILFATHIAVGSLKIDGKISDSDLRLFEELLTDYSNFKKESVKNVLTKYNLDEHVR